MRRVRFPALLAFVALASFVVACGGSSSADEAPPAGVTPATGIRLVAKNLKFDKKALATFAGADVVVTLDNQDAGTLHNFALYRTKDFKDKVFGGELFAGKKTVENRFKAPEEGVYYFRCDAHPDMKGTLTVN